MDNLSYIFIYVLVFIIGFVIGLSVREEEFDDDEDSDETIVDDFEVCVLCGKKTNTLIAQPVEFRNYYVEGTGQLCYSCATTDKLK